jgi:thiol-disulfide isomerase/thioredoxin
MQRIDRRGMLAAAAALALAPGAARAGPRVGKPAPGFRGVTFAGEKVSLDAFAGDVIVLNFWATWCGPCRTELPLLDTYYKLRRDAGLRVLAVTTEDSAPDYLLKPLAQKLTLPLVRHFSGPYGPIGGAVPSNFVVDRAGVLRYANAGAFELDDLNGLLVPLLREAAPERPVTPSTTTS